MLPDAYAHIAHADWSVDAGKRWLAAADRQASGWRISPARPVGAPGGLIRDLARAAGTGVALLGVDLPIGVPAAWARVAGVERFVDALAQFGAGRWRDFFAPAAHPGEIGMRRPFFPAKPGRKGEYLQSQLIEALGVADMDALRRRCDFDARGVRAATPLFWTLGGAQVGKAALSFWQEALQPAQAADAVAVWPFDGDLAPLAHGGRAVVAETYPGEVYDWFGLGVGRARRSALKRSKRRQGDRAADGPLLLAAGAVLGAAFDPDAEAQVRAGFPDGGEDAFDAMVGLVGMLHVVTGRRPEGVPDDPIVRTVEGWILGRAAA